MAKRASGRGWHLAMLAGALLIGCSKEKDAPAPKVEAPQPYVIGLGEIMGLTQMRHAKLWFAGQSRNWPLAAYELDELKEGFDDAVKYHPSHKDVRQPLTNLVPEFVGPPLDELEAAIKAKDRTRFTSAFDRLSAGCNACHKEADFGFNVVKRPTVPPYSNQSFAPIATQGN